jgi:3-oxoacyl-[acyl-carrier-protein] synthase II
MQRVVVTGTGALTSYGLGTETLWNNLLDGKTVIENIPASWKLTPNVKGFFSPLPTLDYKALGFSKMELTQYESVNLNILVALDEALKSAQIVYTPVNNKLNSYALHHINTDRLGVFSGTGIGGIDTLLNNAFDFRKLQRGERGRLDPFSIAKSMPNNVAASIGIKLGLHKHINSYTYACATGTITIGKAYESIKNGLLDVAIAGSSESLDREGMTYNGFLKAKTIITGGDSETVNCPFDEKRSGFLFSEGASGVLVLESLAHAQKRDAHILAELVGFEESFDGYNMVSGDPSGVYIEAMIQNLLCEAKIEAKDIDYINAHGTGTLKNDEVEAEIFERLFGDKVAINSTKSLLGHTIAASGSIEAIVTMLSMRDQKIHKNNGLVNPIKKLHFVQKTTDLSIEYALSASYAFGGHNGALLFKRYKEDTK